MADTPFTQSVEPAIAFDRGYDSYVVSLIDKGTGLPVVNVRVPGSVVEQAVLAAIPCALELRPDGTIVAFAEHHNLSDLANRSLADLIAEAMTLVSAEDDPADLSKLETMLADGLIVVRRLRDRHSV